MSETSAQRNELVSANRWQAIGRQLASWLMAIVIAGWVVSVVGCGRSATVESTWAAHNYPTKNTSLNGLGYLEKLCLQKGTRFKVVNRLSPRLDRTDCLILLGDTLHPPAKEARDWMEEWLAQKSGRKVIYFGRDFDAAEYYLQQTLDQQPDAQRLRAGLDWAIVRSVRDDMLYEQMDKDYFCRWFFVRVSKPERVIEKFTGPWSEQLTGSMKWPVRSYLDVADIKLRDDEPDWPQLAKPSPVVPIPRPFRRTRPTTRPAPAPAPPPSNNRNIFTSFWIPGDIENAEEWEKEWDLAPDAELLLVGADGTPLVTRLTSELYPESDILVLANGAPLFNGMMVDPDLRTLNMQIAEQIGDGKRVALLPYDSSGIQVSRVPDMDDELAGLSVLMTWPLNILMAHLAFLGVILCVALFPILGRPQNLKGSNVSDFGQHAEAMGQLLQASRDLPYALQLVRDYLRIVRGESVPAWLESELAQHSAALPITVSPQTSPPIALPPPTQPPNQPPA